MRLTVPAFRLIDVQRIDGAIALVSTQVEEIPFALLIAIVVVENGDTVQVTFQRHVCAQALFVVEQSVFLVDLGAESKTVSWMQRVWIADRESIGNGGIDRRPVDARIVDKVGKRLGRCTGIGECPTGLEYLESNDRVEITAKFLRVA